MSASLEAVPKSLFSWTYDVREGGNVLATVSLSWFRERGAFSVRGVPFEIVRESAFSRTFQLLRGTTVVATAHRPHVFARRLEVECGSGAWELVPAGLFLRAFVLRRDGVELGRVAPAGLFSRKALVTLPDEVPREVAVFLTWLVIVAWRRRQRSS